jgi:hypothetical protein
VQYNATDLEIAQEMPDGKVSNYCYQNKGNLKFENVTKNWGLEHVGISNGTVYADLDNDGDLELVINNINEPASIYENKTNNSANFLKIKLKGNDKNTFGIGAKVIVQHKGEVFYQEQMPTRGFQSSVDYTLNFGIKNIEIVDSVTVIWSNGVYETFKQVKANQTLNFEQKNAQKIFIYTPQKALNPIFLDATHELSPMLHEENAFSDFSVQRLLTHGFSTEGAKIAVGDANGDGLEDVFLGGAKGQSGKLFFQQKKGKKIDFVLQKQQFNPLCEDVDAVFFDADGDKDLDLYVASGGNEWTGQAEALLDRLYLNDGKGNFKKSDNLPKIYENTACVRPCDYDLDGDLDLFVGGRVVSGAYGKLPNSFLLKNDGKGRFSIAENNTFAQLGMVTDAVWTDTDNNKRPDLVVVGEWLPLIIFKNNGNNFEKISIEKTNGWWNVIKAADLDNDGDVDFVAGNHGLNCDLTATDIKPLTMYVKDFDENGSLEQMICYYNGEKAYPFASQDELIAQLPSKRKQYLKYNDYATKQIEAIFEPKILKTAQFFAAYEMQTSWIENKGSGKFVLHALPTEAQFSPTRSILVEDFDGDGFKDLVLGGNFYAVVPKIGRYDASFGNYLQNDGKGNFKDIAPMQSGWRLTGEIRDLKVINLGENTAVLAAKNNDATQCLVWRKPLK